MGFAVETVKEAFNHVFKTRNMIILAIISALFSLLGLPLTLLTPTEPGNITLSLLIVVIAFVILLLNIIVPLILGYIVICSFKKDGSSLSGAFKVFLKYVVKLVILDILLLAIYVLMMVVAGILLFIFTSTLPSPLSIILSILFGVTALIVFIHISVRLTLPSTILILEDLGIIDSIKKSWDITNGKVVSIFAASILLGIIIIIPTFTVTILLTILPSAIRDSFIIDVVQSIISSIITGFSTVVSYVLLVFIYKKVSKSK